MKDPDVVITSADHPSLDDWFADFLAGLRAEHRYFGPSARTNPKPFPSLIDGLGRPDGFRIAAVGRDRVVGALRIDPTGGVLVAVARGRRDRGIGTALLQAALAAATEQDWPRLVIRTSRRSTAVARTAAHVGAVAVEADRGRVELIMPVGAAASA